MHIETPESLLFVLVFSMFIYFVVVVYRYFRGLR